MPPRSAADILHDLFCRFLHRPGFLSHLRSLKGYDEPEILPYSTRRNCLIGADAGHTKFSPHKRSKKLDSAILKAAHPSRVAGTADHPHLRADWVASSDLLICIFVDPRRAAFHVLKFMLIMRPRNISFQPFAINMFTRELVT